MRHLIFLLVNIIVTAVLLLSLIISTGIAVGMFMSNGHIVYALCLLVVGIGLIILTLHVLGEDVQNYKEARRAMLSDAYDWPFNHIKS